MKLHRYTYGDRTIPPQVSVVIPFFQTFKSGKLQAMISQVRKQDLKALELIVVEGAKPSGRARNIGVLRSKADYVVLMDDYTILGNDHVFSRMLRVLREDKSAGIVGVSKSLPPHANRFMRQVRREMPRTTSPKVKKVTDSDIVTTTCMMLRRNEYISLGGQHEGLIRGTDPELRERCRNAGLRTVVAPGAHCYKPQADSLEAFVRTEWRRGLAMVWAYWMYPETMFRLPEAGSDVTHDRPDVKTQLLRYLLGIPWSLVTGTPLLALAKFFWATGFVAGLCPWVRKRIGAGHGVWPIRENPYMRVES